MRFMGFGLGLFVVLAAFLILGTFAADYKTFLRQHYDSPKTEELGGNYCNIMMQRREMTEDKMKKPRCKDLNTFIHDKVDDIIAVCGNGGNASGKNLRRSIKKFQITICKNEPSTKSSCNYREENPHSGYIVIACEKGLPVHFETQSN